MRSSAKYGLPSFAGKLSDKKGKGEFGALGRGYRGCCPGAWVAIDHEEKQGCGVSATGKATFSKAINCHAPLTPRSTQSTGLFKRASDSPDTFFKRVFRGEGATANFRIFLN